jgi:hypothetical protein
MKASTQNYFDKSKQEKRESLRSKILNVFINDDILTSLEVQKKLGLRELVTVTRRMAELENDGFIYQTGSSIKVNDTHYAIYKLTSPNEIEAKRVERWKSRRIDWLQQGVNFGYITKDEMKDLIISQALKSE